MVGWHFDPALVIGLAGFTLIYLVAIGPRRDRFPGSAPVGGWRAASLLTGMGVAGVALVSPLHEVGERYLLSAHMVQHLLITLVVPPLWLLGTPGWLLRPVLRVPGVRPTLRALTAPVAAFSLFNAVFALWHVPALYDLALRNAQIHIVEHMSMGATALLTWWPILSPLWEVPALSRPARILYLFLESLPPTIVGAILTFATTTLYPTYAAAPRIMGVSALEDQQLGGLIMWIPGALVYLLALGIIFIHWLESEERAPSATGGAAG